MIDKEARVNELKAQHQQQTGELKKTQASEYQDAKKGWQEEIERIKAANLKELTDLRLKSKEEIEALAKLHTQESEHHEQEVMPKFEQELKETHSKELKQKVKERKVQDKHDLLQAIGEQGISQVDEEIMKEKQKMQRKEHKRQLKREIETQLRAIVEKKEVDFELKHFEDLYALKYKLLDEEESLQKKLQSELQKTQRSQMEQEHRLLHNNLNTIQDLLEKFFDEEYQLRKQIAPLETAEKTELFDQKVTKLIADEEKIATDAKARAQADYDALVKKHEEELAKYQGSIQEISKEDRKKAFLTKKFNIQFEPPSKDKLNLQLAEIETRFQTFKLEKQKFMEEQHKLLTATNPNEEAEIEEDRRNLKQSHKSREEKVLQFQKEEKAKFEKAVEEVLKQQGEQMAQRRKEMNEEEEKDRAIAMQPPVHEAEEQQEEEDDD